MGMKDAEDYGRRRMRSAHIPHAVTPSPKRKKEAKCTYQKIEHDAVDAAIENVSSSKNRFLIKDEIIIISKIRCFAFYLLHSNFFFRLNPMRRRR